MSTPAHPLPNELPLPKDAVTSPSWIQAAENAGKKLFSYIDPFGEGGLLQNTGSAANKAIGNWENTTEKNIADTVNRAKQNPQKFIGEDVSPLVIGMVGPGEFGGEFTPKLFPEKPVEKVSPNTIVSASGREMQLPPERTTGVPESDEAIRKGGAIPGGKIEKVGKMEHDIHLFHDPQTGSTLALPADKISPESVSKHMADSRAKFAAGQNKLSKVPGSIEVVPSEISKTAHASLGPIPQSLKGSNPNISDESIFGHEYGHAAHGLLNGGTVQEMGSHWHPANMEIGAAAHTRVTFPSQGAKTFSEWMAKDPSNTMTALQHSLAGPITQEVVYGVPIWENPGASGDMQEIRSVLSSLDLTPEQAKDTINYLANGWRNKLTEKNPLTGDTLGDIIKKYAPRNEDIDEEYLASPEKLRNFAQEVYKHESQLREGNNRGNGGGVPAATEGQRTENAARPKGKTAPINIERSLQTIPGAVEVKPKS